MNVMMLGNGFDLYHNLLSHYNDFMTIGAFLADKYKMMSVEKSGETNVYAELCALAEKDDTIRKKLTIYKEAYKKTTINQDEYACLVEKLRSNCWFKHFFETKERYGWVALESQVAKVLAEFRSPTHSSIINRFYDFTHRGTDYSDGVVKYLISHMSLSTKDDECIFREYTQFIEILRLYLKIFVDGLLPNISDMYAFRNKHFKGFEYILTFNYTDTYSKLYDPSAEVIHIHGNLSGDIVLGVNSDEFDNMSSDDCKYIKYKKYYQRITKHTLDGLNEMVARVGVNRTLDQKVLYIVGHSLDVSDEDIITVLFDLFDYIVVYYHNDESLDQYVKNLKLIFGAKELSKMTVSQQIVFQKLPPNAVRGD